MEKFWTLTRLNRNGSGVPVWAGKKGGVRYHSEEAATRRAMELIDAYGEPIFINESMSVIDDFVMMFEPPPPPPPVRGFTIKQMHTAGCAPEVGQ